MSSAVAFICPRARLHGGSSPAPPSAAGWCSACRKAAGRELDFSWTAQRGGADRQAAGDQQSEAAGLGDDVQVNVGADAPDCEGEGAVVAGEVAHIEPRLVGDLERG